MLKPIVCLFTAIALSLACTSAQAAKEKREPEEVFKKLDANSDGKLSLDEFKGKKTGEKAEAAEKIFKAKDKDGDGFLSLDEFKARGNGKKNK